MQPPARRTSSSSRRSARPQQVDNMNPEPENGRITTHVSNQRPPTGICKPHGQNRDVVAYLQRSRTPSAKQVWERALRAVTRTTNCNAFASDNVQNHRVATSDWPIENAGLRDSGAFFCYPAFRADEFLFGGSEFQLRDSFKLCGFRCDERGDVVGNRPFRPAVFNHPRDR